MFFVDGDRLVTPDLIGTLLSGVPRDSVLTLARDLGLTAEEGRVSVEQWQVDAASGRLTEVFSCGTSSMITPVGRARSAQGEWLMDDGRGAGQLRRVQGRTGRSGAVPGQGARLA
ncbi:aminotransferase class IV [Streptomyces sioyaensis]|uniref:aminotransferase class IV n=1 Tax=Streptomyces sioyaensis TaxID=67364 RepID=UPI0036CE0BD3